MFYCLNHLPTCPDSHALLYKESPVRRLELSQHGSNMPIGIASVGDIVSVCLLVKDLVQALQECRGSDREFQQLIKELQSLERALLEVHRLVRDHETTPELYSLCAAAEEASKNCHCSIDRKLKEVKKYQETLRAGGSGNFLKDTRRKLQWGLMEKNDLDRFHAEVTAHVHSLQILLLGTNA